jgi:integrase
MSRRGLPPGVYRAGRRTYKYVIDLPREGGRRRQESRAGFRTARDAAAARAARQAELRQGLATDPSRETVAAFVAAWLATRRDVRPSSLAAYRRHLARRIAPYPIGAIPLGRLRPRDVAAWHAALLDAGFSPRTVLNAHALLAGALRQAVAWGMLARNVASQAPPPRAGAGGPSAWTLDQARRFLAVASGHRLAILWRLALVTGMRRGELLALRWEDVDLAAGTINVQRTLTTDAAGRRAVGPPKTASAARRIPLAPADVEALRAHRARQAAERLRAGPLWQEHGLVVTTPRGAPLPTATLWTQFRALCAAAAVPPIPFHGLRHTCASLSLALGQHHRIVAERLGHASPATTLAVYTHVAGAVGRAAAADLAAALDCPVSDR